MIEIKIDLILLDNFKKYIKSLLTMIIFDDVTGENIKNQQPNKQQIPDHPYRILIIGGSGSGKTKVPLNIINYQPDIDKTYLYAKDPSEVK